MAATQDGTAQSAGNYGSGNQSVTFSTSGTNRLCVLTVGLQNWGGGSTPGAPSSPNLTWTQASAAAYGSAVYARTYWAWAASSVTSETVTVNFSGSGGDWFLAVSAWSNARNLTGLTAGTDYANPTANGHSSAESVSVTTVGTDSVVVGAGMATVTGFTANGSTTVLASQPAGYNAGWMSRITGAANGTYTLGGTMGATDDWAVAAIEVLAPSSGASYSDSLTESASSSASFADSATWPNALTDAATAADALAVSIPWADAIAEAVTAADGYATAVVCAAPLSEAATASDVLEAVATWPNSLTESATATDGVLAQGAVYDEALSESASALETLSDAVQWAASIGETASSSDALATSAAWVTSVSEAAAALDAVMAAGAGTDYSDALLETITALDAVADTCWRWLGSGDAGTGANWTGTADAGTGSDWSGSAAAGPGSSWSPS